MAKDLALAGLAHDLNNVLQTVAQVADLLSTDANWVRESDLLIACVGRGRSILESLREPSSQVELHAAVARAASGVLMAHCEGEAIVFPGKPLAFERALMNLFWNSARAGATEVRVIARKTREECRIEVADNGPGIADADLAKVFSPGFSTTASTGLGLQIVQSIIHDHNGSIHAGNGASGGACFEIRIPT